MSTPDPRQVRTELLQRLSQGLRELDIPRTRRVFVNRNLRMEAIEVAIRFALDLA